MRLRVIAFHEKCFVETKNVLFVWAARLEARNLLNPSGERQRAAVAWIDHYLDGVAAGLFSLVENPPAEDANAAIARALGFEAAPGRGSRTPFREAQKVLRDNSLALAVLDQLPAERGKETAAIEAVARRAGVGATKVGDAWRRFKGMPPENN